MWPQKMNNNHGNHGEYKENQVNIEGLLGNTSIILKANEQTKWTTEVS